MRVRPAFYWQVYVVSSMLDPRGVHSEKNVASDSTIGDCSSTNNSTNRNRDNL